MISSGVAYQYAREVFGEDASYLKLGFTHPMPMEKIKEFADKSKNAYVIVDVNHFLNDKPEDAILALGDRIKALHISDYDFVYERHMIPGDGLNDWNKIIGALEKIGYKGAFNYEVNMGRYGYTYKQLIENYEKLFEEYNISK